MQFNVTLFPLLIWKRIYIRRLHRNSKDQGIRGSVLVPVSTFTFLFEEIDVETYIIPKRILNDTGSSHSLQFTRGPLYTLIYLGQSLNLISALNCFVAVSYGTGVRAAGYTQTYRQLFHCSPTKQGTRFTWHVYLQILGLWSGKEKCLYCDYNLYQA